MTDVFFFAFLHAVFVRLSCTTDVYQVCIILASRFKYMQIFISQSNRAIKHARSGYLYQQRPTTIES
jgi:hypothetical protein